METAYLPCVICAKNVVVNYLPSPDPETQKDIMLEVHHYLFDYLYIHMKENHYGTISCYMGNA